MTSDANRATGDHGTGPRPAAVTFVTTEHVTLQGARAATIAESPSRATRWPAGRLLAGLPHRRRNGRRGHRGAGRLRRGLDARASRAGCPGPVPRARPGHRASLLSGSCTGRPPTTVNAGVRPGRSPGSAVIGSTGYPARSASLPGVMLPSFPASPLSAAVPRVYSRSASDTPMACSGLWIPADLVPRVTMPQTFVIG